MSETPTLPSVSGQMFLYGKPVLLTPEAHGSLGLDPLEKPFGFCANIRAIPLTVSEIAAASKHYPIVFASLEQPLPVAIVGVIDDVNLFVDEDGMWERYAYVPGYIRRYPFGVARENAGERYAIVLDSEYKGLGKSAKNPLFVDGKASKFTEEAIEFTRNYEDDRRLTDQFMDALKRFDLITAQSAQYTPLGGGEQVTFANYIACEESRIKDMDDARFLEVRKSGILPLLYAQLLSMANWRNLMTRRSTRFNLTDANILSPVQGAAGGTMV